MVGPCSLLYNAIIKAMIYLPMQKVLYIDFQVIKF